MSWKLAFFEKVPLLGLAVLFSLVTLKTQAAFISGGFGLSFTRARVPNAVEAVGYYTLKTICPVNLHPAIVHNGSNRDPQALLTGVVATLLLVVVALATKRRLPAVTWGIVWFGIALIPVLGFVQTGFQAYADRFTYVPHIGLAIAAVWATDAACRHRGVKRSTEMVLTASIVGVLGLLSFQQIGAWRDGVTLWKHVLTVSPGNPIALGKLGNLAALSGEYHDAETFYLSSLEREEYGWVIAGLARTYHALGDEHRMRQYRDWAARVGPHDDDVQRQLAQLPSAASEGDPHGTGPLLPQRMTSVRYYLEKGSVSLAAEQFADALASFDEAATRDPGCAAAHNLAGIALIKLDRHADASRRFMRALDIEPDNFGFWVNLARVRFVLLDWEGSAAACEKALQLRPTDAEVRALRGRAQGKTPTR